MRKKVAIIRSGVIGLFIALELTKKNIEVDVFERNSSYFSEQSSHKSRILHPNFENDKKTLFRIFWNKFINTKKNRRLHDWE